MTKSSDDLIKDLVEDLQPVRSLKPRLGMGLATGMIIAGLATAGLTFGLRDDIVAGHPDPMFLLSAGIFLVLAFASAWRVVDIARPQVGNSRDGWGWTALMASVLPLYGTCITSIPACLLIASMHRCDEPQAPAEA